MRLDKFLASAERLGSRAKAVAALERGKIYVNESEGTINGSCLPLGGIVLVEPGPETDALGAHDAVQLEIVARGCGRKLRRRLPIL